MRIYLAFEAHPCVIVVHFGVIHYIYFCVFRSIFGPFSIPCVIVVYFKEHFAFFQNIFSVWSPICAPLSRRTLIVCSNIVDFWGHIWNINSVLCVIVVYFGHALYIYLFVFGPFWSKIVSTPNPRIIGRLMYIYSVGRFTHAQHYIYIYTSKIKLLSIKLDTFALPEQCI